MPQPLEIEAEIRPWQITLAFEWTLQGIISINMIHVASWNCTKSLFKESGKLVKKDRFLRLNGPFKIGNKHISESNYLIDN